ncbi:hypothetical protein D3C76_1195320 [compost metagenome]
MAGHFTRADFPDRLYEKLRLARGLRLWLFRKIPDPHRSASFYLVAVSVDQHRRFNCTRRPYGVGLAGHFPRLYARPEHLPADERGTALFATGHGDHFRPVRRCVGVLSHRQTGEKSAGQGDIDPGHHHFHSGRHNRTDRVHLPVYLTVAVGDTRSADRAFASCV